MSDAGGEREELQGQLEQLREQVRHLQVENDRLELFHHALASDIKEPLRTMMTFSGFLLEDCADKLEEDSEKHLRILQRTANRLSGMIGAALHVYGITAYPGSLERLDMTSLLREVSKRVATRFPRAAVQVEAYPPAVRGVRSYISELFEELFANAAMYNDGAIPVVEVGWSKQSLRASDLVTYFVKDNGVGIEPRHHERAFGMFERLDFQRNCDGLGVGLPLCKRIVECHGGRMWLESEPGEGSVFWFTLPYGDSDDASPA